MTMRVPCLHGIRSRASEEAPQHREAWQHRKRKNPRDDDNDEEDSIHDRIERIENEMAQANSNIKSLSNRTEKNEIELKKKQIRVYGFPNSETDLNDCLTAFLKCINIPEFDLKLVTDCRFLPQNKEAKVKCIKVEFLSFSAKLTIMSNCKFLGDNKFKEQHSLYVDNELTVKQMLMKEIVKKTKDAVELAAKTNQDLIKSGHVLKIIGCDRLKEHIKGSKESKNSPVHYGKWLKKVGSIQNKNSKLTELLAEVKEKEKKLNDTV
ncbi:hypothetical protein DdX_08088 [Ditylenchus destructor]|uniref:Uncharacterized protein n=1 Tax=Ditylenchus destructor TaxID=166010 RepID=A0AAD4N5S6_9BILA|nr:hypothetical protein DdX_08088 [Ditylenchus destructor]